MERLEGRIAVVTGGGTGMGRELVRQLALAGADVACCDVDAEAMAETVRLARADGATTRLVTFVADVADHTAVGAFRDAVVEALATEHVNLLFNNAGIAGGGSFVTDAPADWERTFNVVWGGVYGCTRAFLPLLLAADEGHVVNTSSLNGLWASLGPTIPHTAYSAGKFAVRGFSEALITDFRINAPHLRVSVVMPGHVGTSIAINSSKAHGRDPRELTAEQLEQTRQQLAKSGLDVAGTSDDELRQLLIAQAESFRDDAPLTAAAAVEIILAGVRADEWRILVGDDVTFIDQLVRANPRGAYEPDFITGSLV